jgi:hypothetical protein
MKYTLPICLSISAASCGVARGIIPGSDQLVRIKEAMTKTNRSPPITGIAGVSLTAKYGQLRITHTKLITQNHKMMSQQCM